VHALLRQNSNTENIAEAKIMRKLAHEANYYIFGLPPPQFSLQINNDLGHHIFFR
jgi:hypothetical protein